MTEVLVFQQAVLCSVPIEEQREAGHELSAPRRVPCRRLQQTVGADSPPSATPISGGTSRSAGCRWFSVLCLVMATVATGGGLCCQLAAVVSACCHMRPDGCVSVWRHRSHGLSQAMHLPEVRWSYSFTGFLKFPSQMTEWTIKLQTLMHKQLCLSHHLHKINIFYAAFNLV